MLFANSMLFAEIILTLSCLGLTAFGGLITAASLPAALRKHQPVDLVTTVGIGLATLIAGAASVIICTSTWSFWAPCFSLYIFN